MAGEGASVSRRRFLTGGAAAGAVLVATPRGALARTLGPHAGAARASRLFPGTWVAHADLHNHTLLSDGSGDPADAFDTMRSHGLDVAALTDHAVLGGPLGLAVGLCHDPECTGLRGIDDAAWSSTGTLADAADDPGTFCAIRGFEWTSPTLGHVNVWFGQEWVDPERTGGLVGLEGIVGYLDELHDGAAPLSRALEALVAELVPDGLSMRGLYDWLLTRPGHGLLGGGADAIAGFNHPGREPGRFGMFGFDARLVDRMVSMEVFNREDDYLFEAVDRGRPSPLGQCLDAGWRVGLLGTTDEHGTDWGGPLGKGRAGLWVRELSRAGVREALVARRFYATRERGLRLDAALSGVQMGRAVPHRRGAVTLAIDIDGGPGWTHRPLLAQILRPGGALPRVSDELPFVVPAPGEPVVELPLSLDAADGRWLVLRVVDPAEPADDRATGRLAAGRAVAYASPWWLEPDAPVRAAPRPAPSPGDGTRSDGPAPVPARAQLPATGGGDGARATVAGLALGAALAAGGALRRARERGA